MGMQGDLRAYLRQIHQLPVPTLGYLPLWLDTLRTLLAADSVAAIWCDASRDGTGFEATCGYAPQAPQSACERLAACGWAMPPVAEWQQTLSPDKVMCGHVRRGRGRAGVSADSRTPPALPSLATSSAFPSPMLRPAALDECLSGGDVLDVCLLPAIPALGDGPDGGGRFGTRVGASAGTAVGITEGITTGTSAAATLGMLRLLVSRRSSRPRFSAREAMAFESAAAEFTIAPDRPNFPPLSVTPPSALDSGQETNSTVGDDVMGTLVWHRRQPEWADPAALTLMRRAWQLVPGQAWPEACVVVQACQRLADELMFRPSDATSPNAQVRRSVVVPGGTLHLHATHLCGMGGGATERVRIALHLAVPPVIRLLQRLWGTALTPVQREIAMRLLAGQSRSQTREACEIGVQTLKTHLSLMRSRLDPVRDASLLQGLGGSGAAGSAGWA